ncbi:MAG: guanylate kinase [Acutalibacteraceae bacterium]
MSDGQLYVISGPSGCGKDTVISKVLENLGDEGFLSVSMTTRPVRAGEKDGIDYYFVDKEEFLKTVESGKMLEYAKYADNYYGTPLEPVEKLIAAGKTVFLNIEVQGGSNIRKLMPSAKQIFILPPSFAELERRLRKRGTESESKIAQRMERAKKEVECAVNYDYIVINDELEKACDDILSIIRAEKLCVDKMKNKISEVIDNA